MTIVSRLLALHQGTITAASPGIGRGSTFTITLPLAPEALTVTPAVGMPAPATAETVRPLTIVLVEDSDDIRESMKDLLSGLGHEVNVAGDGGDGAELILRVEPDVAIVDVGLPVLDGYQVAARVRERLGRDRLRLIAMTGYGQESDRLRAREAGFDAHLVKPADIDLVIATLSPPETAMGPAPRCWARTR